MDEELLKKLKAAFAIEAEEHIELLRKALDAVHGTGETQKAKWLEDTYRSLHSLKGASRAVDNKRIESVCMEAESVFSILKKQCRLPENEELGVWHAVVDEIEANLSVEETGEGDFNVLIKKIQAIHKSLNSGGGKPAAPVSPPKAAATIAPKDPAPLVTSRKPPAAVKAEKPVATPNRSPSRSHMRISHDRLDVIMQGIEELIQVRIGNEFQASEVDDINSQFLNGRRLWHNVSGLLRKLDSRTDEKQKNSQLIDLLNSLGEVLEEAQRNNEQIQEDLDSLQQQSRALAANSTRIIDRMQSEVKDLLLIPMEDSLGILHHSVRELSEAQGKSVQLIVRGGNVDVDRRIIDSMRDPFLHIIRNAIDHGIETPEERRKAGKPGTASIVMTVDQMNSGRIRIRIMDDGRGIDTQKLVNKVVASGIATREDCMQWQHEDILDAVFLSGISTSQEVTDLSGRGLGMSIVREKAESIGGSASIVSSGPEGTTLLLDLPFQQAGFRGVLVSSDSDPFILPTSHVAHVMRVAREEIQWVKRQPAVRYGKITIPLRSLKGLLTGKTAPVSQEDMYQLVLILHSGNRQLAIQVDSISGEQEVLVKGLGPQLKSVRNISGVGVLSTGDIAPIIHPSELIDSAMRKGIRSEFVRQREEPASIELCRVLVADDSFTSRMLLKNVLEAAGYVVEVTVDGSAAFNRLRAGNFDIVISDVDMPRMDGFVLTKRIRQDRNHSEIPVILITSLSSEEDQERGMDAGANAYIVKSNFDQGELLEVLERFKPQK